MKHELANIRLYVPQGFSENADIILPPEQSHYLVNVMRQPQAAQLLLFNGTQGVWLAEISQAHKKHCQVTLLSQQQAQQDVPNIQLAFAPVKNKTESIIEKAVELGVATIHLVVMRHCIVRKVNAEKLRARAIEAAEQCERMEVPDIVVHDSLDAFLAQGIGGMILHADETGAGTPIAQIAQKASLPLAVLIGPEGGFAKEEIDLLRKTDSVAAFGLGPRILRADTAAIAALATIQAVCGDGNGRPSFRTLES